MRSYTRRFFDGLGDLDIHIEKKTDPIATYVEVFRNALVVEQQMCLCGLLGAETDGLPDEIKQETSAFFEQNIDWLTRAFELTKATNKIEAKQRAVQLLCALEGALLVSKSRNDDTIFETVVAPFFQNIATE